MSLHPAVIPARLALGVLLAPGVLLAGACQGDAPAPAPRSVDARAPVTPSPAPEPPRAEAPPEPERRVTLVAVGDVLLGRYVDRDTYRPVVQSAGGPDPAGAAAFVEVAPILRRADLALANVESPVLAEPAAFSVHARLTFRADPRALPVLAEAGFDVLSFANNHALNFGARGLRETLAHVERAGLRPVGIGPDQARADAPVILEKNRVRVAVLGRTTWLNSNRPPTRDAAIAHVSNRALKSELRAAVRQARASTAFDFLVVFLHWGNEYAPAASSHQRRAARAMIDAGAHLVIGHHPHVVQEVELYGGGLIAYSLGNFVFDNGRIDQRRSVILEVTLDLRDGRPQVRAPVLHPVLIDRHTRAPRLARGREYRIWRRKLAAMSPDVTVAAEPPEPEPGQ